MTSTDQTDEVVICIDPLPNELLPHIELVMIGQASSAAVRMARERYGTLPARCGYVRALYRRTAKCRILYLVVSASDAAGSARAQARLVAARADGISPIVLAVLGDGLGEASDVAALCDAVLVSDRPAGLLHLLNLMLPSGGAAIGYDLADVLAIWRGGVGQITLVARAQDSPLILDAASTISGISILLEDENLTSDGLLMVDRLVDRLRPALPPNVALLHAYNQTTIAHGAVEIGVVRPARSTLGENGSC